MARTVWKYVLKPGEPDVAMPAGAKLLTVQGQGPFGICIWAEVDPAAETVTRRFAVYGTGQPMPEHPGTYLDTAMLHDGAAVFHVYEVRPHA